MALGAGPSPQGHRLRSGRPPAEEPDVLDLIMLQRGSGRSLASMEIWLTLRSHPRWPAATGAQSTRERPSREKIAARKCHSARQESEARRVGEEWEGREAIGGRRYIKK